MSGEPQQTPQRETLVSYEHLEEGFPFNAKLSLPPVCFIFLRRSVTNRSCSADQQQVLKKYRSLFHERDEPVPVIPGVWHTAMHNHHDVNTSYDLFCQYLRNIHAMEQKGTHTYVFFLLCPSVSRTDTLLPSDSDEEADDDSMFSSDDEMPPLEEATPSTRAPSPVLVPTGETAASHNANVTDANTAANDDAKATVVADDTNTDPPVPDLHPCSTSARWKNYWESVRTVHKRGHQDGEYIQRAWCQTDGEGIERAWAEANTLPSSARLNGTSKIHHIRVSQFPPALPAKSFVWDRRAYTFLDMDGNVVIKKQKMCLLSQDEQNEDLD
ncbi:hypothetical protein C8R47DRAFT_1084037 [Mycena vitilis]|nr:hypothetical protein C8R47DRAFT_1084037 [Mycena vitilis]